MDFDFAATLAMSKLPAFATREEMHAAFREAIAEAHEDGRILGRLEVLSNEPLDTIGPEA